MNNAHVIGLAPLVYSILMLAPEVSGISVLLVPSFTVGRVVNIGGVFESRGDTEDLRCKLVVQMDERESVGLRAEEV